MKTYIFPLFVSKLFYNTEIATLFVQIKIVFNMKIPLIKTNSDFKIYLSYNF